MTKVLYFAYCTLLDVNEMAKYCPGARPDGKCRLHGYRLIFSKYGSDDSKGGCNLEKAPGHEVLGMLYEMTSEEIEALDEIAGVRKGYYKRIEIEVTVEDEKKRKAFTYIVPDPGGAFKPEEEYTRPIFKGAKALRLPEAYIGELGKIVEMARQENPQDRK